MQFGHGNLFVLELANASEFSILVCTTTRTPVPRRKKIETLGSTNSNSSARFSVSKKKFVAIVNVTTDESNADGETREKNTEERDTEPRRGSLVRC